MRVQDILRAINSIQQCTTGMSLADFEANETVVQAVLYNLIVIGEAAINIPVYIMKPATPTRYYHPENFLAVRANTDAYKFSFIPRTIVEWNGLPENIKENKTSEAFKQALWCHLNA